MENNPLATYKQYKQNLSVHFLRLNLAKCQARSNKILDMVFIKCSQIICVEVKDVIIMCTYQMKDVNCTGKI